MDANAIAEVIRPVLRRYGVSRAVLFGSFATGRNSSKSDVDLILVKETQKRFFDRYDGILEELYDVLPGRDIDVLIYTKQEVEGISHRPFIKKALREGKVIYESG